MDILYTTVAFYFEYTNISIQIQNKTLLFSLKIESNAAIYVKIDFTGTFKLQFILAEKRN
jgi:hypothetical protein